MARSLRLALLLLPALVSASPGAATPEDRLAQAERHWRAQQWDEAVRDFRDVRNQVPATVEADWMLATSECRTGRLPDLRRGVDRLESMRYEWTDLSDGKRALIQAEIDRCRDLVQVALRAEAGRSQAQLSVAGLRDPSPAVLAAPPPELKDPPRSAAPRSAGDAKTRGAGGP